MLDCAGFFKPLIPSIQKDLQFLQSGSYKPLHRRLEPSEIASLCRLYPQPSEELSDSCTLYHYAKITCSTTKREVLLKDATSGDPNIVSCTVSGSRYVGQVRYFFSHGVGGNTNELACMDWMGTPEQCIDSMCHLVQKGVPDTVSRVVWVSQVSSPLVYTWEDGILWLPML